MSLLELRCVDFAWPGGRGVLDQLSLTVDQGSMAAILGPNGAGKTTLLDVCLGWKKPQAGGVFLQERPLSSFGRSERGRLMSLVPQHENARFDFSVTEYVLLGRAPHLRPLEVPGKRDLAIAMEALEATGIAHLALRSISRLSGGEYQLMLVARSLAQEPSLLLLDEPASQLDPANQLRVVRMLRTLASRGISVLYTSHNPQTAAVAADTIHLLSDGRLRFSGPPQEVLTERNLLAVYRVPLHVVWTGKNPHFYWDVD